MDPEGGEGDQGEARRLCEVERPGVDEFRDTGLSLFPQMGVSVNNEVMLPGFQEPAQQPGIVPVGERDGTAGALDDTVTAVTEVARYLVFAVSLPWSSGPSKWQV